MPIPIWYTFGNHMHWVDMEWLWGYHVLPGSIRDMLHFCRETGAKGNVNFDGVGYEKLAAEDPEALAELRQAVQEGIIEVVGGSYGQPYGLFHGGESNIRQRVYGARTVRRLLGVWPQTFWEEEFDFFPQLPQMLVGVGYSYASLFFQWTWHTPEVPREEEPVVWWEGIDGSRLLTATRNRLNLHQWPEDIAILMDELASGEVREGLMIQQWLELMPSPDWMCRSEVLLPKTKELLSDPRFEFKFGTLSDCIRGGSLRLPVQGTVSVPESPPVGKRLGKYLPHWRQEGATYAVTFRLDDSLPREALDELAIERQKLEAMAAGGLLGSRAAYFEHRRLFQERYEEWLNRGIGTCALRDPENARIVAEAIQHFDSDRYRLHAWCVMPNHVHAVVEPLGSHSLESILHSWKAYSAREINKRMGWTGRLWQEESYDHLVRGERDLYAQLECIRANPTKAGLQNWQWVSTEHLAPERLELSARTEEHVSTQESHGDRGSDREPEAPATRRYTMDQVWHGMSLGKNGDELRQRSAEAEGCIVDAEVLASIASVFGRPYAQWDVYPTWQLEEAWRELLQAQHHDNDECEGLCGHIGKASYQRSYDLSSDVLNRTLSLLRSRISSSELTNVMFNTLGWERTSSLGFRVPAFGFAAQEGIAGVWFDHEGELAKKVRGTNRFVIRKDVAKISLESPYVPCLSGPLGEVSYTCNGSLKSFTGLPAVIRKDDNGEVPLEQVDETNARLLTTLDVSPEHEGVDLTLTLLFHRRPDPGMNSSAQARFGFPCENPIILADTPYAVQEVTGKNRNQKKYPTGDWMTSAQWFETVEDAFTSLSLVDLLDPATGNGLLILHKGVQQWLWRDGEVRCILNMVDPWDEAYCQLWSNSEFRLVPHGPLRNSERYKLAQEFRRFCRNAVDPAPNVDAGIPLTFGFARCEPDNVLMTALYRETEDYSGRHVELYAGEGMGYPYVLRLVEFDGLETDVEVTIAGTVAWAAKTNLLGSYEESVERHGDRSADREPGAPATVLRFKMRPHEIATIYMDIVEGRKQTRDLDAARNVWATVHRVEDE